jgi:hypothetical protein
MMRLGFTAVLIATGTALLGGCAAPHPAPEQLSHETTLNTAAAAKQNLAKVTRDDAAIRQAVSDEDARRLKSLGHTLSADAETAEEYVPPGYTESQRVTYWTALADQIIAGYDLHRGDSTDASAYLRAAAAVADSIGR